jgi:chromosome partitioning protein
MATIILFGCEKGGTGKTTFATNVAGILASFGKKVLLIDHDKQGSSSPWAAVRDENESLAKVYSMELTGMGISRKVLDHEKHYDYVICDAGGRDSFELREILGVADIAILPFKPSQFDIWTIEKMSRIIMTSTIHNHKLKPKILINMASTHPHAKDRAKALEATKEFENLSVCDFVIKNRTAYMVAPESGKTVFELNANERSEKAIEEMKNLVKFVIS